MKKLLLLFLIILTSTSVQTSQNRKKINSDIVVSVDYGSSNTIITAVTEEKYSHSGYKITYRVKVNKNKFIVNFKNINTSGNHATAFGSAAARIDLGNINEGEYEIVFVHNNEKTNGTLIKNDSTILIVSQGGNVKQR